MTKYHKQEDRKTFSDHLADFCIDHRVSLLIVIGLLTVVLGYFATQVQIRGHSEDLLPDHPYMDIHNEYKETFGGSNIVTILVQVKEDREGTIFRTPILKAIMTITRDLRNIESVNPGSITSLASSKLRTVKATTRGTSSEPLMWPDVPESKEGIEQLKNNVRETPTAYGTYVSRDFRATLITVDFYDDLLNPISADDKIRSIVQSVRGSVDDVRISLVGQPILAGWIYHYILETLLILIATVLLLALLRPFLSRRPFFQSMTPVFCALLSGLWAFGGAGILGLDFNPLVVVIALLIGARAISASVQSILRFDREAKHGAENSLEAARRTLGGKWTPGFLAMLTDGGVVLIVAITPIPVLQKAAYVSFIWLLTIPITAIILTPLILSFVRDVDRQSIWTSISQGIDRIGYFCAELATGRSARWVVVVLFVILLVGGYMAVNVPIGNTSPGTTILWPDSTFNRTVADINKRFPGSNQMFTVIKGDTAITNPVLEPEVVQTVRDTQRWTERLTSVGRTISYVDIIKSMNKNLNEGDPRYARIPRTKRTISELLFIYLQGASPSDFKRLLNRKRTIASIRMFFSDQRGTTVRNALSHIKSFVESNPMKHAQNLFAGGLIGVRAATNEIIRKDQLKHIGMGFLLVILLCGVTYRAREAGLYLMIPIVLANVLTFAYMWARGIGLNINSLPVAALGIGLGIDKAIYVTDRIQELLPEVGDLREAIRLTMQTAGRSVIVTDIGLILALLPWYLFSHLRFQAEMAILINIWMFVASLGALLVMPALIWVFRPGFVMRKTEDESET